MLLIYDTWEKADDKSNKGTGKKNVIKICNKIKWELHKVPSHSSI